MQQHRWQPSSSEPVLQPQHSDTRARARFSVGLSFACFRDHHRCRYVRCSLEIMLPESTCAHEHLAHSAHSADYSAHLAAVVCRNPRPTSCDSRSRFRACSSNTHSGVRLQHSNRSVTVSDTPSPPPSQASHKGLRAVTLVPQPAGALFKRIFPSNVNLACNDA